VKVIGSPREFKSGRKVCLAIGFFDGVHLGHQQIIRQTITDARQHDAAAVVITFDQHPNSIVSPAHVPPLIYSLEQKIRTIRRLGPEALLLISFDAEFSRQTGESFIRGLAHGFGGLQSICVGADFVFGHRRSGDVALLKQLGAELEFFVHGLAAVSLDGKAISSTRIRERILAGDLDAAGQMLGRAYSISGRVIEGDKLGRTLGFPTANLEIAGLILPPCGVYAAAVEVGGKAHHAVLNIGRRPTLNNPAPPLRFEAHILDYTGDLYGHELEVTPVKKLREEQKFSGLDELKAQIGRDIRAARAI
jgi:riboflavin kinase / FMN adenylyltransferase